MTLDRVSLHTIKGHFCSLLISNIFCDPHFLDLPFAHITTTPKTQLIFYFSKENPSVLFVSVCCQKVKWVCPTLQLVGFRSYIYFQRDTAVFGFLPIQRFLLGFTGDSFAFALLVHWFVLLSVSLL